MDDFLHLKHQGTGETLRLRRVRNATGEIILFIDGTLPPHAEGPPPHIHFHQAEEGVVKSGTLGASLENKKFTVPAGGTAAFPAGMLHYWWNAGDDLLEFSGHATPAGDLDRFLQALFAVLNASPSGRPSIFFLAHVLHRHRNTQAVMRPPQLVQRIVFPVIIFVGRILGKYRGDAWPGSPASSPGAPEVKAQLD